MKPNILLVDDSPDMCEMVRVGLERDGYAVTAVNNAKDFLLQLAMVRPDAILLDLVLSGENGLDLISKIREQTNAPVIVVSGKGDLVDKVVGLEMGADDYVSKPFQMKELSTRLKAQLRRYKTLSSDQPKGPGGTEKSSPHLPCGEWILDRARLQIYNKDGASGELTVKEFRLLEAFIMAPNQVLTREQLLDKSRENDLNVTDRAIDTQIVRIRKKIGDDSTSGPQMIQSVRGIGYMFVPRN